MNGSTAYQLGHQIGVIAGVIIFFVFLLGLMTFFVISLVKAMTTRRPGWIVAASVSGVPFVAFFILMVIGMAVAFKRGFNSTSEAIAARHGEASPLLTAEMTPISGNAISYQISLPSATEWQRNASYQQYDNLFSYHTSAYVGVIAEGIGLGTSQHACDLTQKNFRQKSSECSFTHPQPIDIDSHSWLTYDTDATIGYAHVKYRLYVYADTNYTFQILAWSGPTLFDHEAPVFDRIAQSFKLPQ